METHLFLRKCWPKRSRLGNSIVVKKQDMGLVGESTKMKQGNCKSVTVGAGWASLPISVEIYPSNGP